MAIAPLFVKYRTRSGNYYVYDPGTNEIVRIGEVICKILDDFHVLDTDEIIMKHHELDPAMVQTAISQLEELQARGVLCDHIPQLSLRADRVVCQGREESFGEFLEHHRRLLILELTQECNLRCEYCCYGEHYPEFRKHGDQTMSLEVAQSAITDFVARSGQKCYIGFYGGEPLLEFDLLTQIVLFAEELAGQCGREVRFSMTTNGTLLTDERIHFLVAHAFHVLISMDGTKESHDRYRVFRNEAHPEQRTGSYDVVIRNMERFVALYPDYMGRGIALTLTATADVDEVNALLRRWRPFFPVFTPRFVRDRSEGGPGNGNGGYLGIGSWGPPCESGSCGRELHYSEDGNEDVPAVIQVDTSDESSDDSQTRQEFCNWTEERRHRLLSSHNRFVAELCRNPDADAMQQAFPLFCGLLAAAVMNFHWRSISPRTAQCTFAYKCYPGAVRTFCSSQGTLYPCERTGTGDFFKVGNASTGVNADRVHRLTEAVRLLGDCGNCVAKRLCSLCPALILEHAQSGGPDALAFQENCQKTIRNLSAQLEEYTTIMEMNRGVVDRMLQRQEAGDWIDEIEILLTKEQQEQVKVGVEGLEPVAAEVSLQCQSE